MEQCRDTSQLDGSTSATDMLRALREGRASVVKLLELNLRHTKRYQPQLNAVVIPNYDARQVIARPTGFIMEPEEPWELERDVPRVVFSAANPVVDGTVCVDYGGTNRVIGLATCRLDELVEFARLG